MILYKIFVFYLGREDSNLRMAVPKTAALPLGDAPKIHMCNMILLIFVYFVNFKQKEKP